MHDGPQEMTSSVRNIADINHKSNYKQSRPLKDSSRVKGMSDDGEKFRCCSITLRWLSEASHLVNQQYSCEPSLLCFRLHRALKTLNCMALSRSRWRTQAYSSSRLSLRSCCRYSSSRLVGMLENYATDD